jgi:hypothetical protein
MFLKYANTRAQVWRHFGVGTWKQGKKLEIFVCSAFRPDASGMRSDASGISKVSVRCLVSVRGNGYFSNGQKHRTLVWLIPDASSVN